MGVVQFWLILADLRRKEDEKRGWDCSTWYHQKTQGKNHANLEVQAVTESRECESQRNQFIPITSSQLIVGLQMRKDA